MDRKTEFVPMFRMESKRLYSVIEINCYGRFNSKLVVPISRVVILQTQKKVACPISKCSKEYTEQSKYKNSFEYIYIIEYNRTHQFGNSTLLDL